MRFAFAEGIMMSFFTETLLKKKKKKYIYFFPMNLLDQKTIASLQMSVQMNVRYMETPKDGLVIQQWERVFSSTLPQKKR